MKTLFNLERKDSSIWHTESVSMKAVPNAHGNISNMLLTLYFYANREPCLSKLFKNHLCLLCFTTHSYAIIVFPSLFKPIEHREERNCYGHLVYLMSLRLIVNMSWLFSILYSFMKNKHFGLFKWTRVFNGNTFQYSVFFHSHPGKEDFTYYFSLYLRVCPNK